MKFPYKKPQVSEIYAPFLPIRVFDETKSFVYPKTGMIETLIDTGYDGFLIIPLRIFNELKLISSELVEDQSLRAESITGEYLDLQTSIALNLLISIEIDTAPFCSEMLIGRQLLEKIVVILNGPTHELVIETN
jgi:predicted aspartyl protease